MLDRPLTIEAVERSDYRLSAITPREKGWLSTLGFALLGSVLLYPLLGLPYITFTLAFAGFTMLPFVVAMYLWYRDLTGNTPRVEVTEITAPVLLPQLPPK